MTQISNGIYEDASVVSGARSTAGERRNLRCIRALPTLTGTHASGHGDTKRRSPMSEVEELRAAVIARCYVVDPEDTADALIAVIREDEQEPMWGTGTRTQIVDIEGNPHQVFMMAEVWLTQRRFSNEQ